MSAFLNNILSSIDPAATSKSPAPAARPPAGGARPTSRPAGAPNGAPSPRPGGVTNGAPAPRPAGVANGGSQAQPQAVKRKAEAPPDGGQVKIPRTDGSAPPGRPNVTTSARSAPPAGASKSRSTTPSTTIPYRGTAGSGGYSGSKPANPVVKKPTAGPPAPAPVRPGLTGTKSVGAAPSSAPSSATAKKGSYAAMLQRAKEVQEAKPPAPLIKHEPTRVLTKAERLALRAEIKGKKPELVKKPSRGSEALRSLSKAGDVKGAVKGAVKGDLKDRRKPADVGYQGTARPVKKPTDIGYKGTARPNAPQGSTGKAPGPVAAKAKAKGPQGRYGGYASWSDEEEEEVDDEEGYESSDMEGGMWDVEKEEELAAKIARKEDAEALAEENKHKRIKEERRKKLEALNSAAAARRKF